MIPDDVHRFLPIFPVQLHGSVWGDAIGCQECDHISGATVCQVRIDDPFQLLFADSSYGKKLLRLLVQDLKGVCPKGLIDPFRNFLADTPDLTGRQIGNDAFPGGRDNFFIPFYGKLDPVLLGLAPAAFHSVSNFVRSGQAITDGLELIQLIARRIPKNAAGFVDRDHKAGEIRSSLPGEDHFLKLTKH